MLSIFKKHKDKIIKNPFLTSSLIVMVGVNVYNLGQFLLHIMVGRMLGRALYGDFVVLINILGIFALVQQSLGLTLIKFISAEKSERAVTGLIKWAIRWNVLFSVLVAGSIVVFAQEISRFLNVSQYQAIYILAPLILLGAVVSIARSVLQGLLKFGWFVVGLIGEIGLKLVLSFLFLMAGWAVVGTLMAIMLAVIFSLCIFVLPLRKYDMSKKSSLPKTSPLLKYSGAVFLQSIALTSMYSTDLFLVKHFFSQADAGLYAGLVKLGSIVFFAASPVVGVMFPFISKKYSHGERYHSIFYLSLVIIGGIAGMVVLLYVLFPSFFLLLLGKSFLDGTSVLWWFALFMGLLSVGMVFVQFYLSIGKTWIVWLFLSAAVVQGILIFLFHSSLLQVIQMSLVSVSLLVVALSIYFPYHNLNK